MTILLFSEDPRDGQMLADRLSAQDSRHLYLAFSPADAAAALREVRADRVVCPAGLTERLRLAAPAKSPPRFIAWPERVTEDWLRDLTDEP